MASAKMSLGSVFNVVTASAQAVVSIAESVGTGAAVLASEASHMQQKLAIDNEYDLLNHQFTAELRAANQLAQERSDIQKWRTKSTENAQMFDTALTDIKEAYASRKTK